MIIFGRRRTTVYEEGKNRKVGVFDPAASCPFASRVAEYSDRVAEADAEPSLEAMQEVPTSRLRTVTRCWQ